MKFRATLLSDLKVYNVSLSFPFWGEGPPKKEKRGWFEANI